MSLTLLGAFLFILLYNERGAAKVKVRAIVDARHVLRVIFNSLDAVSNTEHILFGFCCAFAGYLMTQLLHQLNRESVVEKGWVRHVRRPVRRFLLRLPGFELTVWAIGSMVRRVTPAHQIAHSVLTRFIVLRFFVRVACSGSVAYVLLRYGQFAYNDAETFASFWAFLITIWMIWRWSHVIETNALHPEFVMLVFGFGIWLEGDLSWKISQIAIHKNTVAHAAWHLALSLGALFVSIAWFRLSAMRRGR